MSSMSDGGDDSLIAYQQSGRANEGDLMIH